MARLAVQITMTKELSKIVLTFLQDSNRPYSAGDIVEKCGKHSGKSAVQRALDNLVANERVIEKQYGKQKIYFIKQEDENNESSAEIKFLEQKYSTLTDGLKTKEEKIKQVECELKKLSSLPSLEELQDEHERLKSEINVFTANLDAMKSSQPTKISSSDAKEIEKKHEKMLLSFRKRKRLCNDMIDAILEGYPKTKKHLIEEVGIETDESVGFKLDA